MEIIELSTHPKFVMVRDPLPKYLDPLRTAKKTPKRFKNKRKVKLRRRYGIYKNRPEFYTEVRKRMIEANLRWEDLSIYCERSIGTVRDACSGRTPNMQIKLKVARLLKIPKEKLKAKLWK